ncbi:SMI1/KNR4 family protein [Flavobacterium sp.]|uniref:SMI1/KNR4 family protein n=1 Tax=Flavobacterium sp. TaxID=239 RepID=UPI002ED8A651
MDNPHSKILNSIENFKEILEVDYLFLPVVQKEDIAAFENKFNITIPEDYRYFLLNIANGIVNRNKWGLNLVEEIDFKDFFYEENEFNPSLPFELTTKVVFGNYHPDRKDSYPYEITYDGDYEIFMKGYSNGQIHIAGYGCGTSAFIVVNGSEYGNIWINDFSSNNEVCPEFDFKNNKSRLSFTDWLLESLDRVATIYNQNVEWENRIKEEERVKQDKIDEQNKEREIKRLDQIKREKFAEQNKQNEIEKQRSKRPRRDLLTYLIDKIFH